MQTQSLAMQEAYVRKVIQIFRLKPEDLGSTQEYFCEVFQSCPEILTSPIPITSTTSTTMTSTTTTTTTSFDYEEVTTELSTDFDYPLTDYMTTFISQNYPVNK